MCFGTLAAHKFGKWPLLIFLLQEYEAMLEKLKANAAEKTGVPSLNHYKSMSVAFDYRVDT